MTAPQNRQSTAAEERRDVCTRIVSTINAYKDARAGFAADGSVDFVIRALERLLAEIIAGIHVGEHARKVRADDAAILLARRVPR